MKLALLLFIPLASLFLLSTQILKLPAKPIALSVQPGALPIINITVDNLRKKLKNPAYLEIISSNPQESLGPYPISLEISGNTAVRYPKNRLNFQFARHTDWLDGINRKVLNLRSDDDWVLDGAYRDKLIFRNKLNHDLYNELSGSKNTINSRFVEVYVNSKFEGLYNLLEKPDRKLYALESSPIEQTVQAKFIKFFHNLSHKSKYHIGYKVFRAIPRGIEKARRYLFSDIKLEQAIYKAQLHGADLFIDDPLLQGYYQKFPKERYLSSSSNLKDFILFINNSTEQEFQNSIWKKLDRVSTINYLHLLLLNTGEDNNKANYYLVYNHNKFFLKPWDLDRTFRSVMIETGKIQARYDIWTYDSNALYKRLLNDDPQFLKELKDLWFKRRKTILSSNSLKVRFKKYYSQVSQDDAIQRNHKRWNFEDPKEELELVLDWIDKRLEFVDQKLKSL